MYMYAISFQYSLSIIILNLIYTWRTYNLIGSDNRTQTSFLLSGPTSMGKTLICRLNRSTVRVSQLFQITHTMRKCLKPGSGAKTTSSSSMSSLNFQRDLGSV